MKYISRSVKYLVKLLILLAVIFALMLYSNMSAMSLDNFFADLTGRKESWLLLAAILVWSAFYPRVEFVTRRVAGNLREDKIGIINALSAGGMILSDEGDGRMVFRSEAPLRRLWWMWDDAVILTQDGGQIIIEGPRRFAGEAQNRIPGYVERIRN